MRLICKFLLSSVLLTLSGFAQSTSPLKGITEVMVVTLPLWEAKWTTTAPDHTMDEQAIQAEIESELTAAGFKVVPRPTDKSVALVLTVKIYPTKYGTPDSVVYTELAVKELANPRRDPTMGVTSETWRADVVAGLQSDLQKQVLSFTQAALRGFIEGAKMGR